MKLLVLILLNCVIAAKGYFGDELRKLQEIVKKQRKPGESEFDREEHEAFKRQASEEFRQRALALHNELRARHGAPPLILDEHLNQEAQAYAAVEARNNAQKHSCGPCEQYGENLAYSASTSPPPKDGAAAEWACAKWYEEVSFYNFRHPGIGSSSKWGHFSALIWKSTQRLGIGVAYGTKISASGNKLNTVFVVARYFPPGNVLSVEQLTTNVLPPRRF